MLPRDLAVCIEDLALHMHWVDRYREVVQHLNRMSEAWKTRFCAISHTPYYRSFEMFPSVGDDIGWEIGARSYFVEDGSFSFEEATDLEHNHQLTIVINDASNRFLTRGRLVTNMVICRGYALHVISCETWFGFVRTCSDLGPAYVRTSLSGRMAHLWNGDYVLIGTVEHIGENALGDLHLF